MAECIPSRTLLRSRFCYQAQSQGLLLGLYQRKVQHRRPQTCVRDLSSPHNSQQNRFLHRYRKPTGQDPNIVSPFADPKYPLDEAIKSRLVHLVSPNGEFRSNLDLHSLISRADKQSGRRERFVRQVHVDRDGVPVVKFVSRKELQESAQLHAKVRSSTKAGGENLKELELSWAIDEGDLPYRLRKVEEWLREGKNVQVALFRKRRGNQADENESQKLVDSIVSAASAVGASLEGNAIEGSLGGDAVLRFKPSEDEGSANKTQLLKKSKEEKKKQKEEEKRAWKAELEERKKRKKRLKQWQDT
ncbi:MAG: hypothetical protein M1831_004389 [Alyxoria varia]|nr:MAG: hypothetical protein M1831_004389 [Alyxoria varia]